MDAGVAALAMACVCEPVLASPGGGGFAMIKRADTAAVSLIDFFPQTPKRRGPNASEGFVDILADFGTATQRFHIGPASVATPGFFRGVEAISADGARFSLSDLFDPAIQAARGGVTVTPYQSHLAKIVLAILTSTPDTARLFAPGGSPPPAGGTVYNSDLGFALETMARGGFADSEIGRTILKMQADRGNLTKHDLEAYQLEHRDPLEIACGGSSVFLNPLPAASGTIIAYALDRLAGPGPIDMARALDAADRARTQAEGDLAMLSRAPLRQKGTTHISVADAEGNACAITVSNGAGNGEVVDGFGFMLNNILGEEDVNPFGGADWPTDTRLASMMCPTLVIEPDGGICALGSGGSNRIRSAIFQTLARHCLRGETLAEAITAPRMHVEAGHLDIEEQFRDGDLAGCIAAFPDHRIWPGGNMFFGGVHGVRRGPDGRLTGIGDPRRDGVALIVE